MGYLVFHLGIPTTLAMESQLSFFWSSYFIKSAFLANWVEPVDEVGELTARLGHVIH